jgi:hypothetical protein
MLGIVMPRPLGSSFEVYLELPRCPDILRRAEHIDIEPGLAGLIEEDRNEEGASVVEGES